MGKYIDLIAWDDCPHLQPPYTSQEKLDEFEASMLPHQRKARRSGRPSLGAGAVYPVDEDSFLIEPFKIPDHYSRAWAFDVGWNRTAAIFGAKDEDTGITYLTAEYYQGESKPIVHAHGIKSMLPWPTLEGAIDPAAKGSNQRDGTKLREEYEDLGLNLVTAENAVSAGVHHVLTQLQSGMLKVFRTCTYWQKECRLYRRDTKGKIIKKNDHLMDATRYLMMTPDIFTTEPKEEARDQGYGEF